MKEVRDEIWVLADNRPGNYSQAVGLAEELDFEHKIVNISYGSFAVLPNLLLGASTRGLSKGVKKSLSNLDYYPKVIISAGRRTAPVSLYLKKQSGNKVKIIQIMNPDTSHKKFDCIILPRHDRIKKSYTNVIRSIGALTKINKSVIDYEIKQFKDVIVKKRGVKKIALLVGGDSKNTKFDLPSARILCKQVIELAKNNDSEIVVINSRRTSDKIDKIIVGAVEKSGVKYQFFDYNKIEKGKNPYLALIGVADAFVVTGDSVSMISEVCSLGKPVYIFDNAKISSRKHRKFHKSLMLENYAQKLVSNADIADRKGVKKLNETDRIAKIIKQEFFE